MYICFSDSLFSSVSDICSVQYFSYDYVSFELCILIFVLLLLFVLS